MTNAPFMKKDFEVGVYVFTGVYIYIYMCLIGDPRWTLRGDLGNHSFIQGKVARCRISQQVLRLHKARGAKNPHRQLTCSLRVKPHIPNPNYCKYGKHKTFSRPPCSAAYLYKSG